MSLLRQIFVDGNGRITSHAIEAVRELSTSSSGWRKRWMHKAGIPSKTPLTAHDETQFPEVPIEFQNLLRATQQDGNTHYQQALIVWYMLYDAEFFGRYMLRGESAEFQETFMKAARECSFAFLAGTKLDGSPFKPGDNLALRRTGHYITRMREMFACL
jgi:hypothetical protein